MTYSAGILNKRVTVQRRVANTGSYGTGSSGYTVTDIATIWANVTWSRGIRAMREGAVDAYDQIMVRCRYRDWLTRDCILLIKGRTYQIDTLHASYEENTIQITATEMVQG